MSSAPILASSCRCAVRCRIVVVGETMRTNEYVCVCGGQVVIGGAHIAACGL